MRFPALLALSFLFLAVSPAAAVIMKLTHLSEVLEGDDFIFVATVDKVDPDKPLAVFKVEKKLKGEVKFERIPVNMTGNDESKKANDTKTIFDRLDPSRKVVFFISKRGKKYNAKVFVEGSWFSVQGTEDETDKTVRWAFQNGEPFLRRTFKGTSAELVKVCEDGLAGKAKPPLADDKEKEGYGPAVEKKEPKKGEGLSRRTPTALFGVIPSFALVGPMAIIAALFPGVFAKMAVGMKRWRAFLVVASVASTVACIYWALQTWWPSALPSGRWGSPEALTVFLIVGSVIALVWSGRRYRRMAAQDASITNLPGKTELYSLAGLTAAIGLIVLVVALFADWHSTVVLPMREITFIGIALGVATLYAGYRKLTPAADTAASNSANNSAPPPVRLSLSGESVGLAALGLCWFTALMVGGGYGAATSSETGDADAIGPRFVGVKTFEVKKSSQVLSNITIVGDRLYFGAEFVRSSREGQLHCIDRETGEEKWRFGDDDEALPVFCTPTVADGKVYCGEGLHENSGCRLFCVNAADGKPAWEKPFKTSSHTEGRPGACRGQSLLPGRR